MSEKNDCNFQIENEIGIFRKQIEYLCRLKIKVATGYTFNNECGECDGKDCIFIKILRRR